MFYLHVYIYIYIFTVNCRCVPKTVDLNKDGYVTRAEVDQAHGGPEGGAKWRARMKDAVEKYEAGDANECPFGGPKGLAFMCGLFALDGDTRMSLNDALLKAELA